MNVTHNMDRISGFNIFLFKIMYKTNQYYAVSIQVECLLLPVCLEKEEEESQNSEANTQDHQHVNIKGEVILRKTNERILQSVKLFTLEKWSLSRTKSPVTLIVQF